MPRMEPQEPKPQPQLPEEQKQQEVVVRILEASPTTMLQMLLEIDNKLNILLSKK